MNKIGYIIILMLCMTSHNLCAQADYLVEPLSLNHHYSNEIFAFPFDNGIIYSSDRRTHILVNRVDSTHLPLFHLFYAPVKDTAKWGIPHLLSKNISLNAHQGPFSISADEREIYFSLNEATGQRIYSAVRSGNEWTNIRPFAHNRPKYTTTHPSLSRDGKRLFFASDMPGGFGGFDIYVCERTPSGWGTPKNLGSEVNTPENELYPFIQGNGELYFSSSAHGAMGGLDIFSVREIDGSWGLRYQLEEPINSTADDISYIAATTEGTEGYFASNRTGKTFNIFSFKSLFPVFTEYAEQEENDYTYRIWDPGQIEIHPDSATLKYMWDLGDGTILYGDTVWHTYKSPGQYNIYLNVVDTLTGEVSKQAAHYLFDVLDIEQPYITVVETVTVGKPVPFDASKTYLPDIDIEEFYWMFGDGTRKKGIRTEHIYATPGIYNVRLGVTGRSKYTGEQEKVCVYLDITVQ